MIDKQKNIYSLLMSKLRYSSPNVKTNTPTYDNSDIINTSLANSGGVYSSTYGRNIGGKTLSLPAGDVYIKYPLMISRAAGIVGQRGTRIIATSDFVGDYLLSLSSYTDHTTQAEQIFLSTLTLDGNKSSQALDCTFGDNAGKIKVNKVAHGRSNNDAIKFKNNGGTLPTGLSYYKTYYVSNKTDDYFEVSLTVGGTTISYSDAGSGSNQYILKNRHGIYVDGASKHYDHGNDAFNMFHNIQIENCSNNGVYLPNGNPKVNRFVDCNINWCNGDGINMVATDNFISNTNVYGCYRGMYLNGGNNMVANSKTYYSETYGMYLDTSCTGNKISNCETQEEQLGGLYLKSCNNVQVSNIVSEAHGHDGSGNTSTNDGIGIVLDGCTNCRVTGNVSNRNLAGTIQYATKWLNSPIGNTVDISMTDTYGSRAIAYMYDTVPPITNSLKVNNINRHLPHIFGENNKRVMNNERTWTAVASVQASPTNTFTSNGHGLTNGTKVRFRNVGGVVDTGINANTDYYVINTATNTFQVALTAGGSAITLNGNGTGTSYFTKSYLTMADDSGRSAGQFRGWTASVQANVTATDAWDTTELCPKINITNCSNISTNSLAIIDFLIPVTGGDVISFAVEGKVDGAAKFKAMLLFNSDSGAISNTSSSLNASKMWDRAIISKFAVPENATKATLRFAVNPDATGAQNINAWFRNFELTLESVRNEPYTMRWSASPSGVFIPLFIGQKCLVDIGTRAVYEATGCTTNSSWVQTG